MSLLRSRPPPFPLLSVRNSPPLPVVAFLPCHCLCFSFPSCLHGSARFDCSETEIFACPCQHAASLLVHRKRVRSSCSCFELCAPCVWLSRCTTVPSQLLARCCCCSRQAHARAVLLCHCVFVHASGADHLRCCCAPRALMRVSCLTV